MSAGSVLAHGDVVVARVDDGHENRFHPAVLDVLDEGIDLALARGSSLVLTGGGRFFSNGLDLDHMGRHPETADDLLGRVHDTLGRVLGLGVRTVAAVNGHAFGAGAMLALACDDRVMRADRGYLCLPEADLGLPFSPGMTALLVGRLGPATAHRLMVGGARLGGADAVVLGVVDEALPEGEVVERAIAIGQQAAGRPVDNLAGIKRALHAPALDLLLSRPADAPPAPAVPVHEPDEGV